MNNLLLANACTSSDLVMCRKQSGISIGRLCDKCDGKCPVCDSYVRPTTLVRICDECSFGNYQNKCVVCGGEGISDAFYCFECTRLEKDRDGCPKIINLGSSRTDVSILEIPLFPAFHMIVSNLFCAVILPKENESDAAILASVWPWAGQYFLVVSNISLERIDLSFPASGRSGSYSWHTKRSHNIGYQIKRQEAYATISKCTS